MYEPHLQENSIPEGGVKRNSVLRLVCDGSGVEVYVGLNLNRGVFGAKCSWRRMRWLPDLDNVLTVHLLSWE